MNDDTTVDELPELSDEDINLLHDICTRANASSDPPFKALFAAYDHAFAEQGIEQEHDGVVFRLLLRVGEAARERGSARGFVDLVGCLKSILQAQGITVVENQEEEEDIGDETRSVNVANNISHGRRMTTRKVQDAGRRRVSFDDARLDETWLSEHSQPLVASTPRPLPGQHALLSQPPRRGRVHDERGVRRARSISSQRTDFVRKPAPKHISQASPSTVYTSEPEVDENPTLLFQPSQTQLEENAEAFASTSAIRAARRCLHVWHDSALVLHQAREQAYAIAAAHDSRTLVKQAFDAWRTTLVARRQHQREERQRDHKEKQAELHYRNYILWKAWSNWRESTGDQQSAIAAAQRRVLRIRYFHRWRAIALDNAVKARSILARRYLAVWRERLARRQLREEQAVAFCEETRIKRCWRAWFWHFCSRRVELWRDERVKRRGLTAWSDRLGALRRLQSQAESHCSTRVVRNTLDVLANCRQRHARDERTAAEHRSRALVTTCIRELSVQAKLTPIARTLQLKVRLDLERKALKIWHLHLTLCREAAEIDRKRILQSAWTSWNDALRCKALSQRIDERVLVESLYKWVLAERLKLFRRTCDGRLLQHTLSAWHAKVVGMQAQLEESEAAFAETQKRRRLASAMTRLHHAIRKREDAERAAIEFANARALPNVLQVLAEKARHCKALEKWAADARFYTLTTRALTIWKERTTQHQHNRRRDAYAIVRARIKIRLVGSCLTQWRTKVADLRAMDTEAEQRAQARLFEFGAQAFDWWREKTQQVQNMEVQAAVVDNQKLMTSAFTALVIRHADLAAMDEQAQAFRRETDLAVLAAALKKLQWAQFTAARKEESADALWARNRDTHVRQMLRHWAGQAAAKRAPKIAEEEQEPESPSLRPASRAASRTALVSSPPAATPAYMRTPSRSRRAGRFRPLPTPVAVTPFAFEASYLTTTPAPLPTYPPVDVDEDLDTLTPQVTPFARKLRAGGFATTPAPALRSSVFGRSTLLEGGGGTVKSVRFAGGSRFGSTGGHLKSS